jgi:hypothetical protein
MGEGRREHDGFRHDADAPATAVWQHAGVIGWLVAIVVAEAVLAAAAR